MDEDAYPTVGLETNFPYGEDMNFAVRAGFSAKRSHNIEDFSGPSAGFGLIVKGFRLDYAWVPFGDLGTSHRVSMGFVF